MKSSEILRISSLLTSLSRRLFSMTVFRWPTTKVMNLFDGANRKSIRKTVRRPGKQTNMITRRLRSRRNRLRTASRISSWNIISNYSSTTTHWNLKLTNLLIPLTIQLQSQSTATDDVQCQSLVVIIDIDYFSIFLFHNVGEEVHTFVHNWQHL